MQECDTATGLNFSCSDVFQQACKTLAGIYRTKEYALGSGQFFNCSVALHRRRRVVISDETIVDFNMSPDNIIRYLVSQRL